MVMKPLNTTIIVIAAACLILPVSVVFARPTHKLPQTVQDLYYGVGLYYFFQDKYFEAITRLRAAQSQGRITHHREDTELLIGGMYMNYAMHLEAQRIFHALLDKDTKIKPRTKDQAWFLLGRGLYEHGFYQQSLAPLSKQGLTLNDSEDTQRRVLFGNALMQLDRDKDAEIVLRVAKKDNPWSPYARYNRAVALMNLKQPEASLKVLAALGDIKSEKLNERRSLRDKANLAVGFHYAREQKPKLANQYFEKIRIHGLLSNRALLGMGWSWIELKEFRRALVPWFELQKRDIHDSAVLEVYLAIPRAFAELNANREALQQYQTAIDLYKDESAKIRQAIEAVKAGRVLQSLVEDDDKTGLKAEVKLKKLPSIIENHYLIELIAGHHFQAALKSYLNMRFLRRNLQHRVRDVGVFKDILAFRRHAFRSRLPEIMARYRSLDLPRMRAVRDRFAARVKAIETGGISLALASQKEKALLAKLQRLEKLSVSTTPGSQSRASVTQAGVISLMRRRVLFDIYANHSTRLDKAQRRLVAMDLELGKATKLSAGLLDRRDSEKSRLDGFDKRILTIERSLVALQQHVPSMVKRHEAYISAMAVRELEKQLKRLDIYITQAELGVAQIMDRDRENRGSTP